MVLKARLSGVRTEASPCLLPDLTTRIPSLRVVRGLGRAFLYLSIYLPRCMGQQPIEPGLQQPPAALWRGPSLARAQLRLQPSLHSDLADEHEHVERAGLGHVHRDGAVHNGQAPAPASSNHGACAGQRPVAPQQSSTKQTTSKLATSSSSNAAVGETATEMPMLLIAEVSIRQSRSTDSSDAPCWHLIVLFG